MLDTTDDESEDLFQNAPTASQGPIMVRWKIVKSDIYYYTLLHFEQAKRLNIFKLISRGQCDHQVTRID